MIASSKQVSSSAELKSPAFAGNPSTDSAMNKSKQVQRTTASPDVSSFDLTGVPNPAANASDSHDRFTDLLRNVARDGSSKVPTQVKFT